MRKHIPNFLTSLNLLSGCFSLVFAFKGDLAIASLFIGTGAFFDFIDGFAARLLHVKSSIGKELDSLADVVTFGLVPGVLIYQLMQYDLSAPVFHLFGLNIFPFTGFLVTVFSALRLAKFNTDTRQEDVFYGLPTPATALFVGSFPLILNQQQLTIGVSLDSLHELLTNFYVLGSLSVFLSWIMVSEIRLFSLKLKSFAWNDNKLRFIFLGMSLVLMVLMQFAAIPLIILLYVMFSLFLKEST